MTINFFDHHVTAQVIYLLEKAGISVPESIRNNHSDLDSAYTEYTCYPDGKEETKLVRFDHNRPVCHNRIIWGDMPRPIKIR